MISEPPFTLVDPAGARAAADRLFAAIYESLAAVLAGPADIRHIGATAVPGCLTKGDLDIVVRVPAAGFADADATLAARYARNDGSPRTDDFSAFEDAASVPHLGIQFVAINGQFDFFHQFADALRRSPQLVTEYNALKRTHEGADMKRYRAQKDAFIARVLADVGSSV